MFSLISYFAAFVTAVVVMVLTDDDPNTVSPVEWALFAAMAYSAYQMIRRLVEIARRGSWT